MKQTQEIHVHESLTRMFAKKQFNPYQTATLRGIVQSCIVTWHLMVLRAIGKPPSGLDNWLPSKGGCLICVKGESF